jgi:hypothetical protein
MMAIIDSQTTHRDWLECMLKSAVVMSWDALMKGSTAGLIHVEYQTGDDGSLDFLKVWESTIWGQWKLVCEFWTRPLWSHATGVRFASDYHSADFSHALELAVGNKNALSMLPNLHGMVQVFPPTEDEQEKAETVTRAALDSSASTPAKKHIAA